MPKKPELVTNAVFKKTVLKLEKDISKLGKQVGSLLNALDKFKLKKPAKPTKAKKSPKKVNNEN